MASTQLSTKRPLEDDSTPDHTDKKTKLLDEFDEEFKCTICQEMIYQPTTLECGHNFCLTCIHSYEKTSSYRGYECPNCRFKLPRDPKDYQPNHYMKKLMNKLGGEAYQALSQKREMDKLGDRVIQKFYSSQLCKLIKTQIDQELKDRTSISYSELTEKLKSMFGTKYDYAITVVLIYDYSLLGDQIIGQDDQSLLNFLEQKENLTNDQLIYLIQDRYQSPKNSESTKQMVKMLKLYQTTIEIDKLNFLKLKLREIPNQRGRLEVFSELEELIDLHDGQEEDDEGDQEDSD